MGQKVNPHGLRVGVNKDWSSKWYADKRNFADYLVEDNKIREFVSKKLYAAGVSNVVIERAAANQIKVVVMVSKSGMVIGRSGAGADELKAELAKMTGKNVLVDIVEIRRSELDAQLTSESIAQALEKRGSFRRAMKQAISRSMKAGAKGVKVVLSGRIGRPEVARTEKYSEGNVPLHTLRADIDYGFSEADTQYGRIGVKVWINHGEILEKGLKSAVPEDKPERDRRDRRDRRDGERRPRRDRDGEGSRERRDGDRRGRRGEAPVAKPVNPRKRLHPVQPAKPVEEAPAEAAEANAPEAPAEA